MGESQFGMDLEEGLYYQKWVAHLFNTHRFGPHRKAESTVGKEPVDLLLKIKGSRYTAEVKYQRMGAKTGNIAFEIYDFRKFAGSGLGDSIADFWIEVIPQGDKLHIARMKTKDARELARKVVMDRTGRGKATVGGDDESVLLVLFPIKDFFERSDVKVSLFWKHEFETFKAKLIERESCLPPF